MSENNSGPKSEVKKLILALLSEGRWVSSTELLERTKQKYFDRRIRELRDEMGYDVEMDHINGDYCYRLRSQTRNPQKKRTYLNKAEKNRLLSLWDKSCSLCGCQIETAPSFDHRVPLSRGGSGELTNFQIVCFACNNRKRSECRGCNLECKECYLAYPEQHTGKEDEKSALFNLLSELKEIANARNTSVTQLLSEALDVLRAQSK